MSAAMDERISDELEALEAILMQDVVIKTDGEVPFIQMKVVPSTGDDVDQQYVCVTLEVQLIAGYPDVSPEVALRNPRGLDDKTLNSINNQIKDKLEGCLGQPVVFELIELVRENLTESNLPSGQCVICLYDFADGDAFIKTNCYHHFHSQCLANHLIASKQYFEEENDKLPTWQQMLAPPFQHTCPVCRCPVKYEVETLKNSPPPVFSLTAPPFSLTAELKALQAKMASLLQYQMAKGGIIGYGDNGPAPLTITSPDDVDNDNPSSGSKDGAVKSDAANSKNGSAPESTASAAAAAAPAAQATASPQRQAYKGPYRGFNRRGKPGRRGRGAGGAR